MIKSIYLCLAISIAIVAALGDGAYHFATVKLDNHEYQIFDCRSLINGDTKTTEHGSNDIEIDPETKEIGSNISKNDATPEENGGNIDKGDAETKKHGRNIIESDPKTDENGSNIIKSKAENKKAENSPYLWVRFDNHIPQTELQIFNPADRKVVSLVASVDDHCHIGILKEQPWIVATSRDFSKDSLPAFPPLDKGIKDEVMKVFNQYLTTEGQSNNSEGLIMLEGTRPQGTALEGTVPDGNLREQETTRLEESHPATSLQQLQENAQQEESQNQELPQQIFHRKDPLEQESLHEEAPPQNKATQEAFSPEDINGESENQHNQQKGVSQKGSQVQESWQEKNPLQQEVLEKAGDYLFGKVHYQDHEYKVFDLRGVLNARAPNTGSSNSHTVITFRNPIPKTELKIYTPFDNELLYVISGNDLCRPVISQKEPFIVANSRNLLTSYEFDKGVKLAEFAPLDKEIHNEVVKLFKERFGKVVQEKPLQVELELPADTSKPPRRQSWGFHRLFKHGTRDSKN